MNKIFASIYCIIVSSLIHAQVGNLDPSFGQTGIVNTDFGDAANQLGQTVKKLIPVSDGSTYIIIAINSQAVIAHRFADGSLDLNYGNTGYSQPAYLNVEGAAIQTDGKIIVVGSAYADAGYGFSAARFTTDGQIDLDFGMNGILKTGFSNNPSEQSIASDVAIQADGKFVLVGSSTDYGTSYPISVFSVARYFPTGELDHTFDNDGRVQCTFLYDGVHSEAYAKSIAIQTDGKIIAAGHARHGYGSSGPAFSFARFNTDGSLDLTLDNDGKMQTPFSYGSYATSVKLQADGKIILGGYSYQNYGSGFMLSRYETSGSLDYSFGNGGIVQTPFPYTTWNNQSSSSVYGYSLALQDDGKLVMAGSAYNNTSTDFALARYNDDGSLDNSFDEDGKLITNFSNNNINYYSSIQSIAVQNDGKLIAAGNVQTQYTLARYNSDGSLDNSFDGDGKLTDFIHSGASYYGTTCVQSDGKLIAAGATQKSTGGSSIIVARYNYDGTLDNNFDGDGKVETVFPVSGYVNSIHALALQADGKIVAGGQGSIQPGIPSGFLLIRYNSDGTIDNSFDQDGIVTVPFESGDYTAYLNAIAIQNDQKIVTVGYHNSGNGAYGFAIARHNPDGSLDNSFDGDGKITIPFLYGGNAYGVAIQNDGKILVAGYSSDGSPTAMTVVRLNEDGSMDNSFDGDGRVQIQLSDEPNSALYGYSICLQNDGKILVGGEGYEGASINNFAIARLNPDGSLDASFDVDGIVETAFQINGSDVYSYINTLKVQSDGKIITAGYSWYNQNRAFATARYNTDGSLDNSFDGDGKATGPTEVTGQHDWGMTITPERFYASGSANYYGSLASVAAFFNDCTPNTYFRDSDADGFGDAEVSQIACIQPAGFVTNDDDCNDDDAAIHPGAAEVCDSKDNNCNGQTDEGCAPTITSFTPESGSVGTSVTIIGTNFNATASDNLVYFGAVRAMVTSGTTNSLMATFPAGATYQPISVLDNATGLTGYSSKPFITTFANPFGSGVAAGYYKPAVNFTAGYLAFWTSIGDLDGDGKPDMVTVNTGDNTMSVLHNISGTGNISDASFAPAVNFNTGISPAYVSISDLDGDGKLDFAVVNRGSNTVSVYRNTSTTGVINSSSFADKVDFTTGEGPYSLDISDIDLDGKPDIITANLSSNSVSVLRNTTTKGFISTASFSDKVDYAAGGGHPSIVKTGDLNGDGKSDIVVANYTVNSVSVLQNTSTPGNINSSSFAGHFNLVTGSTPFSVAIADLNTDGKPDLAVTNLSGSISVFQNSYSTGPLASSSFSGVDIITGEYSPSLGVVDADGDGKLDLLIANQYAATISVIRNINMAGDISASSFAPKVDFNTVGSPLSVAAGDLNGDGITEIVVSNFNANSVSVFQVDVPKAGALNFDGVNDYVELGTEFNYQNFTVEMWVKPGANQNTWADIIDNNHVYTNNWAIQQDATTTNSYYCYMTGIQTQSFHLTPDVWQHLSLVKSPTQIIIYVDGISAMTYNLPANFNISYVDNHLRLGNVYSSLYSNGRSWNGSLDELRMWNRPLCESEIQYYMNNELPFTTGNGLIAYYKMNSGFVDADNSGETTLIDETGLHPGTLNNFALIGTNSNWTNGNVSGSIELLNTTTWYRDADEDGYGDPNNSIISCNQPPDGYVANNEDCNDTNAYVHPGIPIFTCPSSRTVNLLDNCKFSVPNLTVGLISTNNCSNTVFSQNPEVGTLVSGVHNGSYQVTITAIDANGNSSSCIATLIAKDIVKPIITAPLSKTVNTDVNICSASNVALGAAVYSDNCTLVTVINNAPAIFPKGVTAVIWTATDAAGNTANASQTITVVDNEKPVITSCPTDTLQCYVANGIYTVRSLTAIDNCGVQSINYVISGATSRSGNNNNASGVFNPGTSTITWKVTDVNSNTATCTTTVRIDKVDATIPDVYASAITSSIGSPNTIYIGYGGTSVTLTAQVTSSLSPNSYTYKWTTGSPAGPAIATTQSITVSPSSTITYFVSVKDSYGCSQTMQLSKQVNVVDIRCGANKIYVCKFKSGSYTTNCIQATTNNVNNLAPGSYLGQCVTTVTKATQTVIEEIRPIETFNVSAYPNPSTSSFNIIVRSQNQFEKLYLKVMNVNGQIIEKRNDLSAGEIIKIGEKYISGMYFIHVVQGDKNATIKLIKQ